MHWTASRQAEACKYLHAREPKIVHRDLKSENLLINDQFTAKVSDFGLSRFIDLDAKMTVCGTPSWVAPEIFREERYTEKVDVYSYAILLWELITQDKPHYGFDAIQLPYLVGKEKLRPAVPGDCPATVRRDIGLLCGRSGLRLTLTLRASFRFAHYWSSAGMRIQRSGRLSRKSVAWLKSCSRRMAERLTGK